VHCVVLSEVIGAVKEYRRAGGKARAAQHLLCKRGVLSSNASTSQKNSGEEAKVCWRSCNLSTKLVIKTSLKWQDVG
jgi:hypothetical protein